MHRFWYHSPVRFYPSLQDLEDRTNPQNNQYFGSVNKPYPLEIGVYHRFLIPDDRNYVPTSDLKLWIAGKQIPANFRIKDGKLQSVTFFQDAEISGRFEIKAENNTIFYSNCIQFVNSELEDGRKFIRVATKHLYNRNFYKYDDRHNWMVTNLPAYCLGIFGTEVDVNNARIGGNSTLKVRESFIDEVVEYEFISEGDANILTFIQAHSSNNQFFIDGTKRTAMEKLETEQFAMTGKMKFTNVKDKNGYNILFDEEDILDDVYFIYSDSINYNFDYSHEPENDSNSGEWFLTNLLYNNYYNAFGVSYDCNLKFVLTKVPAKGFLAHNVTRQIFKVGDIVSYCEKDNLTYLPNGFDNDLGVSGNFSETFSYKIIDQEGRLGRETTHTINMRDTVVEPIDISVAITWSDGSSSPQTGYLGSIGVKLDSLVFDPLNPIVSQTWEVWDGTNWVFYKEKTSDNEVVSLYYLENKIRLKVVAQFGEIVYSNVLTYTKLAISNIYITDIDNGDTSNPTKSYKLHVEDVDFVGFVNIQGSKTLGVRNVTVTDTFGGSMIISSSLDISDVVEKHTAVTIPVGVYDCSINLAGILKPHNEEPNQVINANIGYGYTENYAGSVAIVETYRELN